MHTERIKKLLLFLAVLLTGCSESTTYYPTLSHDISGLLPVNYENGEVRYLSGNDTIVFNVGGIVRSRLEVYKHQTFTACTPYAYLEGITSNGTKINIAVVASCNPTSHKVYTDKQNILNRIEVSQAILSNDTVSIYSGINLNLEEWSITEDWGIHATMGTEYKKLDSWSSRTGKNYSPVFKLTKTNNQKATSTVFYLSPGYGLVQLEWQDGTVWSLLE